MQRVSESGKRALCSAWGTELQRGHVRCPNHRVDQLLHADACQVRQRPGGRAPIPKQLQQTEATYRQLCTGGAVPHPPCENATCDSVTDEHDRISSALSRAPCGVERTQVRARPGGGARAPVGAASSDVSTPSSTTPCSLTPDQVRRQKQIPLRGTQQQHLSPSTTEHCSALVHLATSGCSVPRTQTPTSKPVHAVPTHTHRSPLLPRTRLAPFPGLYTHSTPHSTQAPVYHNPPNPSCPCY